MENSSNSLQPACRVGQALGLSSVVVVIKTHYLPRSFERRHTYIRGIAVGKDISALLGHIP